MSGTRAPSGLANEQPDGPGVPALEEQIMPDDGVVAETIARCTAAMVCYDDAERTVEASESMRAEIQAIANEIAAWGPTRDGKETILHSVRRELLLRYGYEAGQRNFAEFEAVFKSAMMVTDIELRPNSAGVELPAEKTNSKE